MVFEFQHSVIPVEEFVARTRFYLNLGYSIRWIFDFRTGESPKCLYYAETDDSTSREKRVVWPGADRVRIFDADAVRLLLNETHCNFEKKLQIFLYVNTGPGKYVRKSNGKFSWGKWEYEDPIGKKNNFYIQPYFDMSENLADFWGAFYTEEEFEKQIHQLCDKSNK